MNRTAYALFGCLVMAAAIFALTALCVVGIVYIGQLIWPFVGLGR